MAFRITRVYTRSGDDGWTGLVGGARVQKDDPRVSCYGTIDELNAVVGLTGAKLTEKTERLRPVLESLQQELFDVGAELATPSEAYYAGMWKVEGRHIVRLETLCDDFSKDLSDLDSFVLPGGGEVAALLHLARTVCRRAERLLVTLQASSPENNREVLRYLNRLSDLFFILARWSAARDGVALPVWKKETDR